MIKAAVKRFASTKAGVWVIKHFVAPLDRQLYRLTNGRFLTSGRPVMPTLLLTTTGRKSGQPRTIPVFYLRDGHKIILCNVNPGFERPNPWTLNIRANPIVQAQIGSEKRAYRAREAARDEVNAYWPQLVQLWPPYLTHFEKSRQLSIFILEVEPNGS